jgi:NAD(P)-dependent dehydrogenase (short-subunit alcohol dehydrogenase family)
MLTSRSWYRTFRRRYKTVVGGLGLQAFLPLLGLDASLQGPQGRIVVITSVLVWVSYPLTSAYGASKHALDAMACCLRMELRRYGIKVIVVGVTTSQGPFLPASGFCYNSLG